PEHHEVVALAGWGGGIQVDIAHLTGWRVGSMSISSAAPEDNAKRDQDTPRPDEQAGAGRNGNPASGGRGDGRPTRESIRIVGVWPRRERHSVVATDGPRRSIVNSSPTGRK